MLYRKFAVETETGRNWFDNPDVAASLSRLSGGAFFEVQMPSDSPPTIAELNAFVDETENSAIIDYWLRSDPPA